MAKRFTETTKWRSSWFRELPLKAKVAWVYLCDECDHAGIWKADYGLASFQLDFKLSEKDLAEWFSGRIHFFDFDKVLILPFLEFQYGGSRETWSARVAASKRLSVLGFELNGLKVIVPPQSPHSGYTVQESDPTLLITDTVIVKGIVTVNKGSAEGAEKRVTVADLESVYESYPRHEGKSKGLDRLKTQIKTQQDLANLRLAVKHYSEKVKGTEAQFIKQFSSFVSEWTDWVDPKTGTVAQAKKGSMELWREKRAAEGAGA